MCLVQAVLFFKASLYFFIIHIKPVLVFARWMKTNIVCQDLYASGLFLGHVRTVKKNFKACMKKERHSS